jgi:hypothetical protein
MIEFILTFGCVMLLCTGIGIISWAVADMCTEDPDIKNIIMVIFGIGVFVFGIFCVAKAGIQYKESKSTKTEIVTSIPPQIDTIITIKNSVSDTTYIYKFNLIEK